jgi:hypothetical protein
MPAPRQVDDLAAAAVLPGRRAERRWRLAEPDLEFRPSAPGGGCPFPQPRNWSGPGTPGRLSDTSAARSASSLGYTEKGSRNSADGHKDQSVAVIAIAISPSASRRKVAAS